MSANKNRRRQSRLQREHAELLAAAELAAEILLRHLRAHEGDCRCEDCEAWRRLDLAVISARARGETPPA